MSKVQRLVQGSYKQKCYSENDERRATYVVRSGGLL